MTAEPNPPVPPLLVPPLEPIDIMSILLLRRSPFSTATLEDGEAEEGGVFTDCCSDAGGGVGRLPPPALSTCFKSLDSTFNELPVESLVMVTDPPDELGGMEEDDTLEEVVGVAEVELGEEDCFREDAAKSLVTLLDEEEDFTGEIVTLLLLLSFL